MELPLSSFNHRPGLLDFLGSRCFSHSGLVWPVWATLTGYDFPLCSLCCRCRTNDLLRWRRVAALDMLLTRSLPIHAKSLPSEADSEREGCVRYVKIASHNGLAPTFFLSCVPLTVESYVTTTHDKWLCIPGPLCPSQVVQEKRLK